MKRTEAEKLFIRSSRGWHSVNAFQTLWESIAIELYLADALGFLPTDKFARAETISHVASLHDLLETSIITPHYNPSLEARKEQYEKNLVDIPARLKYHEALVGVPFHSGDQVCPQVLVDGSTEKRRS